MHRNNQTKTVGQDQEPRKEEALTGSIIDSIIAVHQALGPGFDENVYKRALLVDLKKNGLLAENNKELILTYEGEDVGQHTIDLLVENRVIVKIVSAPELRRAHYSELRSCLRATDLDVGLLANFAGDRADFRRVE